MLKICGSLFLCCNILFSQKNENKRLPVPENVLSIENVVYASNNNQKVLLDFFRPKGNKLVPAIVLLHGGGWSGGSRSSHQGIAVLLAQKGYAVANIDYRLSGEAKFPAAIEDCKAAIRWVNANSEKYHIIQGKIFGIGASAGGHIVSMAALTDVGIYEGTGGNASYSSKLDAIVILGSGVDQYTRVLNAKNQRIESQVNFLGEFKENKALYIEASPITHLSKNDPPVFMLDGEQDKPGERYVDFIEKLKALNISYELGVIPHAKHAQWSVEPFRTDYVNAFDKFLKKH